MGNGIVTALIVLAALGSGLIAGVFFAFSGFVMTALARLPAMQGIAAMNSINVAVINAAFLGVFFGPGALCLALAVAALADAGGEAAASWTRYVAGWTVWNHVRTGASLAAAALFTLALC